jgi:hypothetical protein
VERGGFLKRARAKAAASSPKVGSASEIGKVSNPCNNLSSSVVPELKPSDSHFKIKVVLEGRNRSAPVAAMVDCGATALFISERFVRRNKVRTHPLSRRIKLCNIDGSENRAGSVSRSARLRGDNREWLNFLVTDLGPEEVVLGLPWLRSVNLEIDWAGGTLNMERGCRGKTEQIAASRAQRRRWWKASVLEDPTERLWCAAGYTCLSPWIARERVFSL